MKKFFFACFWCLSFCADLFSQETEKNKSYPAILINVSYAWQNPAGDLQQRFGYNFNPMLDISFLSTSNWMIGAEGGFLFGDNLKEDPLGKMRTSDGYILSKNNTYADIRLDQRGLYFGLNMGKLISFSQKIRQGIEAKLGLGFLQHRIYIRDVDKVIPQLEGDYKKGYDRLANGFALKQYIGYRYMSKNRLINFSIGGEIIEGFTQNRRVWNFDTQYANPKNRLDILFGLRATWTLPLYIYAKNSDDFQY